MLIELPRADCQHLHASAIPALHVHSQVRSDIKVSLCAKIIANDQQILHSSPHLDVVLSNMHHIDTAKIVRYHRGVTCFYSFQPCCVVAGGAGDG